MYYRCQLFQDIGGDVLIVFLGTGSSDAIETKGGLSISLAALVGSNLTTEVRQVGFARYCDLQAQIMLKFTQHFIEGV